MRRAATKNDLREEARRQAALLRGGPEETEALDFIEAAAIDLLEGSSCSMAGEVPQTEKHDETRS